LYIIQKVRCEFFQGYHFCMIAKQIRESTGEGSYYLLSYVL